MDFHSLITRWFWAIAIVFGLVNIVIGHKKVAKRVQQNPELKDGYEFIIKWFWILQMLPFCVMGIGCTIGGIPSVLHFLRIRDGNPYVTVFWLTGLLTAILVAQWVFFREGAEMVVKHPGSLNNMDFTTPAAVKRFALLLLGGYLIGTAILFYWNPPVIDLVRQPGQPSRVTPQSSPRIPVPTESEPAEYQIIFDIETAGYQAWKFVAPGFLFIAIGSFLVKNRTKMQAAQKHPRFAAIFAYYFLGFAILWTTLSFGFTFHEYQQLLSARRDGSASVTEGVVHNFVPMPPSGHPYESFVVNGIRFSYSEHNITPGFRKTRSYGGPIDEGKRVRITYVGNDIAKLEVAD